MKKFLPLCLSILLVCFGFVSITLAVSPEDIYDDLHVKKVECPTTVGIGKSLTVRVDAKNEGDDTLRVERAMVGLAGNPVGTLGGTGIWGPFPRRIYPPLELSPESEDSIDIIIVDKVPSALVNKIAGVIVNFLTPEGKVITGGGCVVSVVP